MKLSEVVEVYTGNALISIEGYCEEKRYDYYAMPSIEEEDFTGNNPNHYIPSCLAKESWYEEVKDKTIAKLSIIGGGRYPVELSIELKG